MESSANLSFMENDILTDEGYSSVFWDLEPLSIPHRPSHLPPLFKYKGGVHPHRKHRPQGSIGNTYIYVMDTSQKGLENARDCGSIDKVPHKPKNQLLSSGKYDSLYRLNI